MSASAVNVMVLPSVSAMRVVVLYDDPISGERARLLFNRLRHKGPAELEFELKFWPFETLSLSAARPLALAEAASAQMLVVSTTQTASMPSEVLGWVRAWSAHGRDEDAALVVLGPANGQPSKSHAQLTEALRLLAESQGVDFLAESEIAARVARQIPQQDLPHREHSMTTTLASIVSRHDYHAYRHWGLNE